MEQQVTQETNDVSQATETQPVRTRTRREVPEIPGHSYSSSVTEWVRKTVHLVADPEEEGMEAEVVGSLVATPEQGWTPDEQLVSLVGPQPAFSSLTDAKINLYKAYDERHLVAERREARIQAAMEMGLSRELAEQAAEIFAGIG